MEQRGLLVHWVQPVLQGLWAIRAAPGIPAPKGLLAQPERRER